MSRSHLCRVADARRRFVDADIVGGVEPSARRNRSAVRAVLHRRLSSLCLRACRIWRGGQRPAGHAAVYDAYRRYNAVCVLRRLLQRHESRRTAGSVVLVYPAYVAYGDDDTHPVRRASVAGSAVGGSAFRHRAGIVLSVGQNLSRGHPYVRQKTIAEGNAQMVEILR